MENNFSVEEIKKRVTKDSKGTSNYANVYIDEMDWLVEQAEKVKKLESVNKKLTRNYINVLISYLELMDEGYPSWRSAAEKEIKQLNVLLNK